MGLLMFLLVAGVVGGFAFYMLKKQKANDNSNNQSPAPSAQKSDNDKPAAS